MQKKSQIYKKKYKKMNKSQNRQKKKYNKNNSSKNKRKEVTKIKKKYDNHIK